jgi:hypothetical protein
MEPSSVNEQPDLPALNDAIEKSKRWMEAAQSLTDGLQFDTTPRRRLSVTLHHLSIEHHSAIHTLVDLHVWGSAFALIRPQLEAYVRGMWYGACATDRDIAKFFKDVDPPPFKKLAEQLEAVGAVDGTLLQLHKQSWKQLCGFTHGGLIQVRNRNTRDDIVSRYELKDVTGLVGGSAVLALSACAGIASVLDDAPFAVKATKAYDTIYGTAIADNLPT